jgi:hypothetical protein
MSEAESPFGGKADFNNESFYYFLPFFNIEQKNKIGEKITQYKGVSIFIFIKLIYLYIFLNI